MNESMERLCTVLLFAALFSALSTERVSSVQVQEQACASSGFRCSNGQCGSHSWRCDHTEDCEDGSDEENCEQNECAVNNGGCSHYCVDHHMGFMCDCPSGMRLVQDKHCEEVNPCLDADVCDQVCVHSNGSFTCTCCHGYVTSSESGRCLAADNTAAVIFSSSEGIVWMKPDGSEEKKITNSTGTAGTITSLTAQNTLYWTNAEHTHIYRLALDPGVPEPSVMFSGVSGITGLAVDWINAVLYWTSTSTGAVHAGALNGTEHTLLVSGLSSPTAVSVQPLTDFLFWADAGQSPRIERSGLNGENRTPLVTSAIQSPVSIALDMPRGLLYWVDSNLRSVSRVTYDGQHRKTVMKSNGYLDQPFSLAVFESGVYWSDRQMRVICHADKHSGNILKVIRLSGASSPGGLLIYHPLLQPTDTTAALGNPSVPASDSGFFWILLLFVFPCVLLIAVLQCWRTRTFSSSLSQFSEEPMMESKDPLVPPGDLEEDMDPQDITLPVPV